MTPEYNNYLVEYWHEGSWWCLEICAASFEDAESRLKQLAIAKVKGVVMGKVPAQPGASFLVRVWCRIRNAWEAAR